MKSSDFRYEVGAVKAPKGLVITGRAYFDRIVSSLPDGQECVLTLTPKKDKRSNQQNRMIWGTFYDQLLAGLAADQYDAHERAQAKELIHEGLTALYQGYVTDEVTGVQVRKFRSSKSTKAEFTAFVEWAAKYAAENFGIVVTLPGETR